MAGIAVGHQGRRHIRLWSSTRLGFAPYNDWARQPIGGREAQVAIHLREMAPEERIKDVTGYDLLHLMVGSEGTLGVFTKIILRLVPAPESVRTLLATFPDLDGATQAVCSIIKNRIIPSTLELLDLACIRVPPNFAGAGSARRSLLARHPVPRDDALCRRPGAGES